MTEKDLKLSSDEDYAMKMGLDPGHYSAEEEYLYGEAIAPGLKSQYLKIRNAVLRVWHQDFPTRIMKVEDTFRALSAAPVVTSRHAATFISFAFKYLDRYRFINYGIVTSDFIPITASGTPVLICGAGIAGLATAREIHNIFLNQKHTPHPKIMLIEARQRIGGRILTFPLHCKWNESKLFSAADLGPELVDGLPN